MNSYCLESMKKKKVGSDEETIWVEHAFTPPEHTPLTQRCHRGAEV